MSDAHRRRRSSSIIYTEPPETIEQRSDQAALPNLNATWVNSKGILLSLCPAAPGGGAGGDDGRAVLELG